MKLEVLFDDEHVGTELKAVDWHVALDDVREGLFEFLDVPGREDNLQFLFFCSFPVKDMIDVIRRVLGEEIDRPGDVLLNCEDLRGWAAGLGGMWWEVIGGMGSSGASNSQR